MSVAPAAGTGIPRILTWLVTRADTAPRTTMVLVTLLVAAALGLTATRLEYHTQRNDLVAADRPCQQRWAEVLRVFGDDDDLVIVLKGATPTERERLADQLADVLRARPELFDRVFHAMDLRPIAPHALWLADIAQLQQLDAALTRLQPLLGRESAPAWAGLTIANMAAAPIAPGDATLARALAHTADPTAPGPWQFAFPPELSQLQTPQYFHTPDRQLTLVLARPRKETSDFASVRRAATTLRTILKSQEAQ
ncbi:MAG: hypothetical protein ACRCZF_15265, partial [Gemmataceae bacterium]